jgi:Cof subfamily protein (haloacid dehalogenase superfamily)
MRTLLGWFLIPGDGEGRGAGPAALDPEGYKVFSIEKEVQPSVDTKGKLLVFDVDGTLLTSSHSILPSTKRALAKAAELGHHIVLATARPPRSVVEIADRLGIASTISIALNGAIIVTGNRILWDMPMGREASAAAIEEARRRNLHANLMAGWEWFVEAASSWSEQEAAIVNFEPRMVEDLLGDSMPDAHKVLIMGEAEEIAAYRQWIDSQDLPIYVSLSKPTYCEIVSQGVSKGSAVKQAAKLLKISLRDLIAFGDGENDSEIVAMAGIGVAMGNAMPQVLEVADLVTKSNDEDGICHALREIGLLEE